MKFVRNILFFQILIALQCCSNISFAYVAQSTTQNKKAAKKTTTRPAPKTTIPSNIPYIKELQTSTFPAAQKQSLITAWQTLYEVYLTKQSATLPTTLTKTQTLAIAPLFTTDFLTQMHAYFANKQNFATLTDDAQNLKQQYATFHMAKACARLASIHDISFENNTPKIQFSGDMRDQGIIVNIKNNTNTKFVVSQNSLDGKTKTKIGIINPGINGVNLHTAALQEPNTKKSTAQASSTHSFNFQELDTDTPTNIAIKMYTGTELIEFLETLPRKDKKIFSMNGLPTSKQYLTNPNDWYMVLIQNPTSKTQPEPNLDQRIQAINISKLTGPYLLSMQINAETVEISAEQTGQAPTSLDLFQPSITTALIPKNQYLNMNNFPVIILSKFLQDMPQLQTLWMLYTTAYIASLSDFNFLGLNSFGNSFEYFDKMGFFNMDNKYAFFIDRYNIIPIGNVLYDAPLFLSSAIYETNLNTCSDIPQMYSAQDTYGHIIANTQVAYKINFLTTFVPTTEQPINALMLQQNGFNKIYALPQFHLFTIISSILMTDIQADIFAELSQIRSGIYRLKWTNKQDQTLQYHYLYLNSSSSNIQISFVNKTTGYTGTTIPTTFIPSEPGQTTHFKISYEFSSINNNHILLAQQMSPIDKKETILTMNFSKYPLTELYFDVYQKFNVEPHTRCFIIQDGILPEPLIPLTEQDWQSGVYIIPTVKNNHQITPENPGSLTLTFYKSNKTPLGTMTIQGQFNNSNETGIKEPVLSYNVISKEFNRMSYLFLSTGILLKYNNQG